ncbi:tripartite tricarboxylate transporter substrate binding protein [Sulfitobacter sp. M57]|uniref:tripartite tricarboxylate transporter substrate binding protein n=1 Tax=unclassified Sulfitobacter TaxID=196795 RepID=UPI0023E10D82|nr:MULTISPECIES: tripartite tricarboxylate transporter substrate binding protein [unclassified Sulfitobacter]MDF3413026.1 tripartite tricarboxylate transporter substrate binding protein [Sulfitobacter sp. KE5]MDF3421690.1 tripartite tricarboxylate transporter substrate binding protein [Sulfitobacter sp. KE43]MDF3431575.1 tripartite tricarboxylate transporter substrate binding protein [Sulfitobacter sp. KE42]MDF3457216.1 tripartite tricarboxylate transporter substrate binding protein [Sulfitobac
MSKFTKSVTAMALALAAVAGSAQAEYPEKPVEFVVPWPPGDLEDVLTRMIAEDFSEAYGVPTAVVNKPGGGGGPFPGAIEVANAPADGYTVGSFIIAIPVVGPQIGIPELNPDPFVPIGNFLTYPFVIATSGDAPYSTVEELSAHAQGNDVVLGHFGAPLVPTQVTFGLAKEMGFEFAGDAAFDALDCNTLASGDVDVINTTLQLILPCLDDVTVLASIGSERIPLTPDAPTVVELAPSLDVALWNGLFVHADTPQDVQDKIAAVAAETMMSDRAQQLAADTGAAVYWQPAAEVVDQIAKDIETLGGIDAMLAE